MHHWFASGVVTIWVLGTPQLLPGQLMTQLSGGGTTITFTLPVNLTQLSPDLERVQLQCGVFGDGFVAGSATGSTTGTLKDLLLPKDEAYVFGGQLVTTMKVMVMIPIEILDNPRGKTAQYTCMLQGYSKRLQRWDVFSETATEPAFLLKPAPPMIQGTFEW